jgi:hypothetical protein
MILWERQAGTKKKRRERSPGRDASPVQHVLDELLGEIRGAHFIGTLGDGLSYACDPANSRIRLHRAGR